MRALLLLMVVSFNLWELNETVEDLQKRFEINGFSVIPLMKGFNDFYELSFIVLCVSSKSATAFCNITGTKHKLCSYSVLV